MKSVNLQIQHIPEGSMHAHFSHVSTAHVHQFCVHLSHPEHMLCMYHAHQMPLEYGAAYMIHPAFMPRPPPKLYLICLASSFPVCQPGPPPLLRLTMREAAAGEHRPVSTQASALSQQFRWKKRMLHVCNYACLMPSMCSLCAPRRVVPFQGHPHEYPQCH